MSLLRYVGVGSLATVAHYAVLVLAVEVGGGSPPWSSFMGACVGALVAYAGNRQITFVDSGQPHRVAMPRFFGVALLGATGNGLIVSGLTSWGLHYLLAQAVATVGVTVLTYHLNRRWTFA